MLPTQQKFPLALLIDDSEFIAAFKLCAESCSTYSCAIRHFRDLSSILTALPSYPFQAIFCNYELGSMGWPQIVRALRDVCPHVPIVILCNHLHVPSIAGLRAEGAEDYYLATDLSPAQLEKTIYTITQINAARQLSAKSEKAFLEETSFSSVRSKIWNTILDCGLTENEQIIKVLMTTGTLLGLNRASCYIVKENGMHQAYRWTDTTTPPLSGIVLPLSFQKIFKPDGFTHISIDELSGEHAEESSTLLKLLSVHSCFVFPVNIGGSVKGYCLWDNTDTERTFSQSEIAVIEEAVSIITTRLAQVETQKEKAVIEEQYRVSQKMEAVGQLAGGIAHDFNNILGAIAGYAEMINRKFGSLDPKLDKYSTTILSAAHRAADLTAKLLAFARRGKYQAVKINLHDTIADVTQLLDHTFGESRIRIEKTLTAANSFVVGDPTQVQNTIFNIALNARDAMPNGGTLSIHTENITLDERFIKSHSYRVNTGRYVLMTITDTGVGMDHATKERIFEPFFTTKEVGKGSGLGLASVYGTVKAHDGYVDVVSEPGQGTTIKIYLPLSNSIEPEVVVGTSDVQIGKGHVMIIDDEVFILDICGELLKELGYTSVTFKSSIEAVQYYQEHYHEIDLVLIDMIMPGLNGRNCFKKLKAIHPSIKAVLSTGYSFNQEAQAIMNDGVLGFIQKPFNSDQLGKVIDEVINRR